MTKKTPAAQLVTEAFGPEFRLETYPFYLIGHLDQRYTAEMEAAMGAEAIGRPVWRTLLTLAQKPGLSIGEIADITLLKRSTLSRVVDRMAADGVVERRVRDADNRIIEVHITDAGLDALKAVSRIAARQYARATEGLSEAEIDELARMLRLMLDNLNRSPFA